MPRRNAPAGFLFSKVYPTRFSQTWNDSRGEACLSPAGWCVLRLRVKFLISREAARHAKKNLFYGSTALCGAAPPPAMSFRQPRLPCPFRRTPPSCHSDERSEEESLRPFPASQTCSTGPRCPVYQRCFAALNMTPGNVIPTNAPPLSIPANAPLMSF